MTDDHSAYGAGSTAPPPAPPLRQPFPFARLIYAVGFAVVAWVVFWLVLFLAVLQFVTTAVMGHANDELKHFSRSMTLYLEELLGYITLVRDEQPFPIGTFPKG
jgi:hypothetical protein